MPKKENFKDDLMIIATANVAGYEAWERFSQLRDNACVQPSLVDHFEQEFCDLI